MPIELYGVELIKFKDIIIDDEVVMPSDLLEEMDPKDLRGLPVYFVHGAVKFQIGVIRKANKGREAMFGDLILAIDGSLETKLDKEGRGAIAVRYNYKRE